MAGVEWNRFSQDDYPETGAGALSMSVGGKTANRLRSALGAKLATKWTLSGGITIMPSVRASWRHEFNHDGVDTLAVFVGGGHRVRYARTGRTGKFLQPGRDAGPP